MSPAPSPYLVRPRRALAAPSSGRSVWAERVAAIPDLFAWWRLGDGPGMFRDSGPHGLAAIDIGTPVIESALGLLPHDEDRAVRLATGARTITQLPAIGDRWSWVLLFQTANATATTRYLAYWTHSGFSPQLYLNAAHQLVFSPGATVAAVPGPFNDGARHFAVFTWDGAVMRLYVDERPPGDQADLGGQADRMNLRAGAFYIGGNATWDGVIDEVAIVRRALNPAEISELYQAIATPTPPEPPLEPSPDWWVIDWGSFNGWTFGEGSPWEITDVDGLADMMSPLKTQDGQLVGDGEVFGWDSEPKRVITITLGGASVWMEHCFPPPGVATRPDRIAEARCANLRRHDDLPLAINDRWVIMARPRRFVAPQRLREVPQLTVSYEVADPAVYAAELQEGTASVGVSEWGRRYPPGEGLTYRGPAGAEPWTWRYQGRGVGGLLAVINRGCRETYLTVRIQGPVEGPMIINQTTFERLDLDLAIEAGEWLDIDFRAGTVFLNGTSSRYWALTRASTWFSCGPGTTFIRYLARGEVTTSTLTAWWRSAW